MGAWHEPEDDIWFPCQWFANGKYNEDTESALDLVNVRRGVLVRSPSTDD